MPHRGIMTSECPAAIRYLVFSAALIFLPSCGPTGPICKYVWPSAFTETERKFWDAVGGGCNPLREGQQMPPVIGAESDGSPGGEDAPNGEEITTKVDEE